MVSDGVLLGLRSIIDWVIGRWFVALRWYGGCGSRGCTSSGTGTAALVFVVVELT